MLSNSLSIYEQPHFIKLTLHVRAAPAGRWVLTGFCVLSTLLFAFIASSVEVNANMGAVILGISIALVLLVAIPWWYLTWNLFGKEHLIITTKSITHQIDHGFALVRPKTHLHQELHFDLVRRDPANPDSMGTLVFSRLNEQTGLPEEMVRTTVLLHPTDLTLIQAAMERLYGRADTSVPVPPPSLN